MSIQSLLEQLLHSGVSKFESTKQSGDLGKYAGGAAAGGVLALLLGSKRGRSLGGTALKLGSVAAIGTLAWKVYQDHQAKQQVRPPAGAAGAPRGAAMAPDFAALPAPQLELHSRAMLKAMIAAAKSDGHLDDRERGVVEAELQRLEADPATRRWVEDELRRPVDAADVAAAATGPGASPQMASEIYLASVLVVDETTAMERAYLDQLAQQLELAPGLKAELEARAKAA